MITTAFDNFGRLWDINEPGSPDNAICAVCGSPMFKRISARGNPHYVLFGGSWHKFNVCRQLSQSRNFLDGGNISVENILLHYFSPQTVEPPAPPKKPHKKGKVKGPAPERRHQILLLQHLCSAGYLHAKDRTLPSGGYLSQLTINPKFSYMLLGLNQIGRRILQGRPCSYNDNAHVIRMLVYIAYDITGRKIQRKMLAELQCPDESTYQAVKAKLFQAQADTAGRKKYVAKYTRIAVMGDWTITPSQKCHHYCWRICTYGEWKCIGLLQSNLPSIDYLCPVPDPKSDSYSDVRKGT